MTPHLICGMVRGVQSQDTSEGGGSVKLPRNILSDCRQVTNIELCLDLDLCCRVLWAWQSPWQVATSLTSTIPQVLSPIYLRVIGHSMFFGWKPAFVSIYSTLKYICTRLNWQRYMRYFLCAGRWGGKNHNIGIRLWSLLEESHVGSENPCVGTAGEDSWQPLPPTNTQGDTKYGATAFILIGFQLIDFSLSVSGLPLWLFQGPTSFCPTIWLSPSCQSSYR